MWLKMAAVGRLAAGSLDEAVAVRRLHGENRIYQNQGAVHKGYDIRARRHVLDWAARKGLEPRVIQPLLKNHLLHERARRVGTRARRRLDPRDLPWLAQIGLRIPGAIGDGYYRHCVKEGLYITAFTRRLKQLAVRTP